MSNQTKKAKEETTHRPGAPKAERLPTRGRSDREVITTGVTGAPGFAAVGEKMASTNARMGWEWFTLIPLRYKISSCLRSVGEGWGQFWPVFLPVVRAHFYARNLAARSAFNGDTSRNWYWANLGRPLPDQLRLRTNGPGQFGLAAMSRKISGELHSFSISESLNKMQAGFEARRSFSFLSVSLPIET